MKDDVTYVGRLTGIVTDDGEEIPCGPRILGVTPGEGLVTAKTRSDLGSERFDSPPRGGRRVNVASVLYKRRRKGWEGEKWIHDTPGALAILSESDNPVSVFLVAPAERRCDMEGDFLCSI
jgi:hypothetical protein